MTSEGLITAPEGITLEEAKKILPEIRNLAIRASASARVCSGDRENGSVMTPFSERFTLSTSSACASIDIFL